MSKTIVEYFEWLCKQVHVENDRAYTQLFHILFDKEFAWTVHNDENRLTDGCELRHEFFGPGDFLLNKGATVLEVIIALSRRLEFNSLDDRNADEWAWQLIKNLHLHRCWDPLSLRKQAQVHEVLDRLIWRQYNNDGEGGFFPLRNPEQDQTKIEIWYQMSAYLIEQDPN